MATDKQSLQLIIDDYDAALNKLAGMFIENFSAYTDNDEGKALVKAGPQL